MNKPNLKTVRIVATFLLVALVASLITYQWATASFQGPLESLPFYVGAPQPYSYIIETNGTHYFSYNGTTGQIDFLSTNASKVFQFAIDNSTIGGKVFARAATYNMSVTLCIAVKYVVLEGEGKGTILYADDGLNGNVINMTGSGKWHQEIKNLQIEGNKANQASGHGIYISHTYATTDSNVLIENVWIRNPKESGVYIADGTGSRETRLFNVLVSFAGGTSFRIGGVDNKILYCVSENSVGHGFAIYGSAQLTACKAFGSGTGSSAKHGFYIYDCNYGQVILTTCWAQDGIDAGFTVWSSNFVQLIGCTADSNQAEGFRLDAGSAGETDCVILSGCSSFTRSGGLYTQTYGIRLKTNTTRCIVTGCYGNGSTAGISDVGTSNEVHISFNGTTYVP